MYTEGKIFMKPAVSRIFSTGNDLLTYFFSLESQQHITKCLSIFLHYRTYFMYFFSHKSFIFLARQKRKFFWSSPWGKAPVKKVFFSGRKVLEPHPPRPQWSKTNWQFFVAWKWSKMDKKFKNCRILYFHILSKIIYNLFCWSI